MRHYDARRLELLAVILALEHFKPYIDGVKVFLDSDQENGQDVHRGETMYFLYTRGRV